MPKQLDDLPDDFLPPPKPVAVVPAEDEKPSKRRRKPVPPEYRRGALAITLRISAELHRAVREDINERMARTGETYSMAEPFLEWARKHYGVEE